MQACKGVEDQFRIAELLPGETSINPAAVTVAPLPVTSGAAGSKQAYSASKGSNDRDGPPYRQAEEGRQLVSRPNTLFLNSGPSGRLTKLNYNYYCTTH